MIKVNLLKSKVGDTTQMATAGQTAFAGASEDTKEATIKAIIVFFFTGALMFYEWQNLNTLKAEVQRLMAQQSNLEQDVLAKDKEVEAIKDIESQSRALEDKLKVLKLLSHLRLRGVKTLDFIQSSMPEKVWLKDLIYESDKEKVETGHFSFQGNSVATEDLTDFVKRLEDSSYLEEVIVMKNQEVSTQSGKGNIRDFLFTAQVEVKP